MINMYDEANIDLEEMMYLQDVQDELDGDDEQIEDDDIYFFFARSDNLKILVFNGSTSLLSITSRIENTYLSGTPIHLPYNFPENTFPDGLCKTFICLRSSSFNKDCLSKKEDVKS